MSEQGWMLRSHVLVSGALNFKDVMLAYGKLDRDRMGNGYCGSRLGFEFSGTLPSPEGDRRVMGVARQAIATHVWGLPYLVRPWTLLHTSCSGALCNSSAGAA